MAAESIGNLIQTSIPGYSDAADIQAALRLYHYGSYGYDPANTSTAALVNPSIAYTINDLQEQIDNVSTGILPSVFTAKGQILSASAASTPLVLDIGSQGQYLSVNTATGTGLQWSALPSATTSTAGIVQLTNSTASTSVTTAATPNSVKSAYDLADAAIPESIIGAKGDILSGSGTSTPSVLGLGSQGQYLTVNTATTTGLEWITIPTATTSTAGIVQLTDSTASTSVTTAATPNSVKSAYDLADAAIPESIIGAKGDLLTGTANDTIAVLSIGPNGYILTADSNETSGMAWKQTTSGLSDTFLLMGG
jgi:hypothetical protein